MLVTVLLYCEALVFIAAYVAIFSRGYRNHLPLLFVLTTMCLFLFLAPLYGVSREIKGLFGNYLWDYYPHVLLNYLLATVGLLVGYSCTRSSKGKASGPRSNAKSISANFIRGGMLVGILGFSLWGVSSGASLKSIFLLNYFGFADDGGLVAKSRGNFYLLLMIEIFIPILALSLYSKMKKTEVILWLTVAVIIYLSQGFRYRLIMLFSSLLIVYLHNSHTRISLRKKMALWLVVPLLIYSVINVSNYRSDIRRSVSGEYSQRYSTGGQRDFLEIVYASTRIYLPFASLIKHMEKSDIPYGYGETMFGHIFIRLIPKFFFENGVKPDPPAQKVSRESWGNNSRLSRTGEAYGGVGGVYYEYGTIGVVAYFVVLGLILGRITFLFHQSRNHILSVLYVVTSVAFFILITRGYLPGFFFSYGFMMLPFVFLKFFLSRKWNEKVY